MAPAPAEALTFESESNTRDAYENFCELRTVQDFGMLRRLEDAVRTARQLGTVANLARNHRGFIPIDPRKENLPAGGERVPEDSIRRDFVALGCVQHDRRRIAIEVTRENLSLD